MPPEAALYQVIKFPVEVAFKLVVKPLQTVAGVAETKLGVALAFTVNVAVFAQPKLFVYVIVEVPPTTPVTTPPDVIVAIPVLEDTHGVTPAGVPEPVSVEDESIQALNVPPIVGNGLTVNEEIR